jgi:hypothetical protein
MKVLVTLPCLLVATTVLVAGGGAQPTTAVELKTVKYAGLVEVVKQNKGKVVVIDFWADY